MDNEKLGQMVDNMMIYLMKNKKDIVKQLSKERENGSFSSFKLVLNNHIPEAEIKIHFYTNNCDIDDTNCSVNSGTQKPFRELANELQEEVAESMRSKIYRIKEEKARRKNEIKAEDAMQGEI